MSTLRDLTGSVSPCARFADTLPLYTSGELAPEETSALRAHLETCETCRKRLAGYDRLDSALQRHVGVPSNAAPFLSFDSIVTRTRSADAQPTPESAPIVAQHGEPAVADARVVAFAAKGMRRGVRPIHEEDIMFDQHDTSPSATRVAEPGAHRHRRARGIAGFAAAVALVALAVAVFQSIGASHQTGKGNNKQPTTPPATQYLGANGKWDTVTTYTVSSGAGYGAVTIAPNNPSIVYLSGPGLTLKRSTDGGATWTSLATPTQDVPAGSADASVEALISPLDAHTVFLWLNASSTDPKCPTPIPGMSRPHIGAKVILSGGYSCSFEYVSRDGGDTWQSLNVPSAGHVGGPDQPNSGFQVQGSWLYSTLVPDLNGPAPLGYRLVKSSDGVNWQYADGALAAHDQNVSQIAAAPSGGELFAVTVPAGGINGGGAYTPQLWHSADGGAHWIETGDFTQAGQPTYAQLMGATTNTSGRALVYSLGASSDRSYQQISVSADGGRTWQPITYNGLPADLTQSNTSGSGNPTPGPEVPGWNGPRLQFVGSLANGSLVVEYAHNDNIPLGTPGTNGSMGYLLTNSHITYYALSPNAATWTQLTPQLHNGFVSAQWISPANGSHPDAIYALQLPNNPDVLQSTTTTLTLSRCALTK